MHVTSRRSRGLAAFLSGSTIGALALVGSGSAAYAGTLPPGTGALNAVSCASATACVAVGTSGAVLTTNGGASWSSGNLPAANWESVSCIGSSCVAAGSDSGFNNGLVSSSSDGGATWHPQVSTPGGGYWGVSCEPNGCLAVGYNGAGPSPLVVGTSGGTWGPVPSPGGSTRLHSVGCVDALHCWVGGENAQFNGVVYATTDGGQTWSGPETLAPPPGQPVQQGFPVSMEFVDAAHGFATVGSGGCGGPGLIGCGGDVEGTVNGGATWSLLYHVGNGPTTHDVSCVDVLHCMVVGGQVNPRGGVIVTTSDGGAHWTQQGGVSPTFYLGVSCPSGGACVVVGGAGSTSSSGSAGSTSGVGGTPPPPAPCVARAYSPAPTGLVARVAGPSRDDTAIAVSKGGFPAAGSAKAVVLASDANYPDALAGSPLAVAKTAPLLLTPAAGLPPAVAAEITRVAPKGSTVYLLGGNAALSPAIDTQVQGLGDNPQRLQGANRFATAVAIAGALGDPKGILEATGVNFPDALSAGAAAAKAAGAVLLTNGSAQAPETAAYLGAHSGDTRTAVGGPAAAADPSATPIVGADRYATSVAVAQHFFNAPTALGFASGANFPDALAGGANIGLAHGPMLVVPPCGPLPGSITGYLGGVKGSVTAAVLYGGGSAVGDDVLAQLENDA